MGRTKMIERCSWCLGDPLYVRYHDEEWGVPLRDDRQLFEFLILDGAQAGLSWLTILRKRDSYRRAFDGFDPQKMARYGEKQVAALLADPGIVRNRLKIASAIRNARAYLAIREKHISFSDYLWQFTGGRPLQARRRSLADIPSRSPESDAMSKALKADGFNFVGTTICYAFMQAAGMVNDHLTSCHRHEPVARLARTM